MKENYNKLMGLLEIFPRYNSPDSVHELLGIYKEYSAVLDVVHTASEDLKDNTGKYYTTISDIEFIIHQARTAKTQREKDTYFNEAIIHLENDITSLAELIQSQNI